MSEVRIRRARPGDLPAVLQLIEVMNQEGKDWWVFSPRPGLESEIAATYRAARTDPNSLHVVADAGGTVVGSTLARIERGSTRSDERVVELSGVVVSPDHRRAGIGRRLVAEAIRFARDNDIRMVMLRVFAQNEAGLRFWERMGFSPRIVQMTAEARQLLP